jgi:thioredoxin 1
MDLKKFGVAAVLVVILGSVYFMKAKNHPTTADEKGAAQTAATSALAAPSPQTSLPRLVDLGASECIPCKMMKPILEELTKEYEGRMRVEFIDVWKNPNEAKAHRVQTIPTQIFYDASGEEQFRHEGFFSKAEILDKWTELGILFERDAGK